MSGSVGRGVDKALGQWQGLKEGAQMEKKMNRFFEKLMKAPAPRKKTKTKKKGGKKK